MRRLANIALSLMLTGLLTVALAVAVIPSATGTKPVTIDRNSMQRVLPYGSLAYIQEQPRYELGDIVTFKSNGNIVTHEIVEILPNPANNAKDGTIFRTQGSENLRPDVLPLYREQVIGRVVYFVPVAGVALRVLGTPVVEAFLVLLAIALYFASRQPTQKRIEQAFEKGTSIP